MPASSWRALTKSAKRYRVLTSTAGRGQCHQFPARYLPGRNNWQRPASGTRRANSVDITPVNLLPAKRPAQVKGAPPGRVACHGTPMWPRRTLLRQARPPAHKLKPGHLHPVRAVAAFFFSTECPIGQGTGQVFEKRTSFLSPNMHGQGGLPDPAHAGQHRDRHRAGSARRRLRAERVAQQLDRPRSPGEVGPEVAARTPRPRGPRPDRARPVPGNRPTPRLVLRPRASRPRPFRPRTPRPLTLRTRTHRPA
jgi:hypothetical protein